MQTALKEKASTKGRERIEMLDLIRGCAMILVILYHLFYDLKFIYDVDIPDVITPGQPVMEFVHKCFLWALFAVSGVCSGFSRDPVKRGAFLYIVGWLITLFTSYFLPSQLIVFGVLSCFGACMVICGLLRPIIDKIPWKPLFVISVILWFMFMDFGRGGVIHLVFADITVPLPPRGDHIYPIGIHSSDFFSTDYFPVIPNIFMYLAGCALFRPISERKLAKAFYNVKPSLLTITGKYSLIVYAVHQPILLILLGILL